MRLWLTLTAVMQAVLAYGMFDGFPFEGWLGRFGGVILAASALNTMRVAVKPTHVARIHPVGESK